MHIGVDLRAVMGVRPTGVGQYIDRVLDALLVATMAEGDVLTGFTSGRQQVREYKGISCRTSRYPNTVLNASISFFNYPPAKSFFGTVDVIWQPNPLFIGFSDVPHFVTIHDLSFSYLPTCYPLRTRLWYLRWVKAWLRRATPGTELMAVSEQTMRDILEHYPQWRGRVHHMPAPLPAVHSTAPRQPSEPYVITVGTNEIRKNLQPLIAAWPRVRERYPDLKLYILGQSGYRAACPTPGVVLLGYCSDAAKIEFIKNAHALVYPSFHEGYGYPPIEALQLGTPVIASSESACAETLGDAAFYINPYRLDILPELLTEVFAAVDSTAYHHRVQKRLDFLQAQFSATKLLSLWRSRI